MVIPQLCPNWVRNNGNERDARAEFDAKRCQTPTVSLEAWTGYHAAGDYALRQAVTWLLLMVVI